MIRLGCLQGCGDLMPVSLVGETEETGHGQRQGGAELELLRHVAGPQLFLAACRAFVRCKHPKRQFGRCRFARTVRPDQRDNLARLNPH